MAITVNARFRQRPTTGVERVATEVLSRLAQPTLEVAPPRWAVSGAAGHLWEQAVLPSRVEGVLWSPCNTGPVRAHCHVVTIHDTAPLQHPEWFSRGFASTYRFLVPRLCRRAAAVVTVSAPVADELIALGADPWRVHVIGNGVSGAFRPADPEAILGARARFGLSDHPYFVVIGSPEPRKNLTRLLAAWHSARLGDARLVLVGRAAANVFRSVELRGGSTVIELGRIDDLDLAPLLSGAVALVSPSLYEGFSLPPVEALACGTPVIVSDIPVHRALLGDLEPVMFDPLDVTSIRRGLEAAAGAGLEVASGEVAGRFSWDDAARAYDELFQRVSDES